MRVVACRRGRRSEEANPAFLKSARPDNDKEKTSRLGVWEKELVDSRPFIRSTLHSALFSIFFSALSPNDRLLLFARLFRIRACDTTPYQPNRILPYPRGPHPQPISYFGFLFGDL
jgi:hypothetical protein